MAEMMTTTIIAAMVAGKAMARLRVVSSAESSLKLLLVFNGTTGVTGELTRSPGERSISRLSGGLHDILDHRLYCVIN